MCGPFTYRHRQKIFASTEALAKNLQYLKGQRPTPLLKYAEILTYLNEGLNATIQLLYSVTCRYLNADTSLTLWYYWVVETCYEYALLLQLSSEVL